MVYSRSTHYELSRLYSKYIEAEVKARRAAEALDNVKDFYNCGLCDADHVREFEKKYLQAREEADRRLEASQPRLPEENGYTRWEPPTRGFS